MYCIWIVEVRELHTELLGQRDSSAAWTDDIGRRRGWQVELFVSSTHRFILKQASVYTYVASLNLVFTAIDVIIVQNTVTTVQVWS